MPCKAGAGLHQRGAGPRPATRRRTETVQPMARGRGPL